MLAPHDFSDYLQSLVDTYRDQQDRYTLTDLQVEYRQEEPAAPGEPEARKETKVERSPVLTGLREYVQQGHVLLLGKPGSGKSTALQRLLWEEAEVYLTTLNQATETKLWIPVLILLRACDSGNVLDWICEALEDLNLAQADVRSLLRERRLLLLFDGLNEVPNLEAYRSLSKFREKFAQVPMVFTTRELGAGAGLGIPHKLEMCKLTEPQMRELIQKQLPGQADTLLRQLQNRLRELAETPLLLKILCDVFQADGSIPKSRGELFRKQFAQQYAEFKRLPEVMGDSSNLLPQLLQTLAFEMMQGTDPTKPTEFVLQLPKAIATDKLQQWLKSDREKAAHYLQALLKHHLLQQATDPDQIEFCHQLFQEYYAAEYLLLQLPNLSDDHLKRDYLNLLKWTEPLGMMAALICDETKAVQIVKLALEVDLMLGARLAGKVKSEFQSRMVTFIEQLRVPQRLKVTLLGMTATSEAISYLEKTLKTEDLSLRRRSTEALSKICSEATIPALTTALSDGDATVRLEATRALADIQSKEAITILMNMIRDAEPLVRDAAAHGLKEVDTDALIVHLQQALLNQQVNIRMQAIEVIEATREEAAIKLLLQASRDINHEIGWKAAHVLAKVNGESAIKHLSEALNNENMEIRRRAVYSLGEIRGANVVESLSKAVADEDIEVRKQAIEALGKVGGASIDKPLIQALEDKNLEIRRQALHALARSGNPSTIETLTLYVNDKDPEVCQGAAYALGEIGNDRLTNVLLQALDNEDSGVRRCVIEALGKIGNDTAIDALEDALRDVSLEVREEAAFALGRFGNDKTEDDFPDDEDDWGEWEGLERVVWDEDWNEEKFESSETEFNESEEEGEESIRDTVADEDSKITYIPSKLWTALLESDEPIKNEDFEDLGNDEELDDTEDVATAIDLEELADPKALPFLSKSLFMEGAKDVMSAIAAIQANCQFYNYAIQNEKLEMKNEEGKSPTSGQTMNIFNIDTLNTDGSAINLGGTVRDQIINQGNKLES